MEVGSRVFHETNGAGIIQFIQAGEIYPIQVEHDNPVDSHKVYRYAAHELKKELQQESNYFIAKVARPRNGYIVGDEYIVGPSSHDPYFNVYLLNGSLIGSYVTDFFEDKRPYDFKALKRPVIEKTSVPATKVLNEPEKAEDEENLKPQIKTAALFFKRDKPEAPKKLSKIEKLEQEGQMNLFDFLGEA